jgi:phosphohistidine phosphatase SixA
MTFIRALLLTLAACVLLDAPVRAQPRDGAEVIELLRDGGYVIAMRHASSPRTPPEAASASPENARRERELDANGKATARAMGDALRALDIRIGTVLTSPTFRALQTVESMGLEPTREVDELGDGGNNMAPDTEGRRSAWLRDQAAEPPAPGTNTLLVTHQPNLVGAFADEARNMADGEALILKPQEGRATVVARVKIDQWPEAAAAR